MDDQIDSMYGVFGNKHNHEHGPTGINSVNYSISPDQMTNKYASECSHPPIRLFYRPTDSDSGVGTWAGTNKTWIISNPPIDPIPPLDVSPRYPYSPPRSSPHKADPGEEFVTAKLGPRIPFMITPLLGPPPPPSPTHGIIPECLGSILQCSVPQLSLHESHHNTRPSLASGILARAGVLAFRVEEMNPHASSNKIRGSTSPGMGTAPSHETHLFNPDASSTTPLGPAARHRSYGTCVDPSSTSASHSPSGSTSPPVPAMADDKVDDADAASIEAGSEGTRRVHVTEEMNRRIRRAVSCLRFSISLPTRASFDLI
jgi:hypothetical protein